MVRVSILLSTDTTYMTQGSQTNLRQSRRWWLCQHRGAKTTVYRPFRPCPRRPLPEETITTLLRRQDVKLESVTRHKTQTVGLIWSSSTSISSPSSSSSSTAASGSSATSSVGSASAATWPAWNRGTLVANGGILMRFQCSHDPTCPQYAAQAGLQLATT